MLLKIGKIKQEGRVVRLLAGLILFLFVSNAESAAILDGYKGVNFGESIEKTAKILKLQSREVTKTVQPYHEGEILYYMDRILDKEVVVQYYFTPESRKMNQVVLQFNIAVPDEVKEILTAKYGVSPIVANTSSRETVWSFENGRKIIIDGTKVIYLDVKITELAKQEVERLKTKKKKERLENLENEMENF